MKGGQNYSTLRSRPLFPDHFRLLRKAAVGFFRHTEVFILTNSQPDGLAFFDLTTFVTSILLLRVGKSDSKRVQLQSVCVSIRTAMEINSYRTVYSIALVRHSWETYAALQLQVTVHYIISKAILVWLLRLGNLMILLLPFLS